MYCSELTTEITLMAERQEITSYALNTILGQTSTRELTLGRIAGQNVRMGFLEALG